LKAAKDAGVGTVVSLSPAEAGRDVRYAEEVSRRSGIHIVVCTGQRLYPQELSHRSSTELTDLFVREIEEGIDGTGIKAGVIKAATVSGGMSNHEDRVLRAAARASKATGTPIQTHSNSPELGGLAQAQLLEEEGVSPSKVSIGHSDDTDDLDYLMGLTRRGYTLGMDHAFWGAAPGQKLVWQKRVETTQRLITAGWVDRIVLSNDWVHGDTDREKVNPDGLLFTVQKTIPRLLELGISKQQIRAMTVENPRRFYGR
jgi:phosphotriesterase-related protein